MIMCELIATYGSWLFYLTCKVVAMFGWCAEHTPAVTALATAVTASATVILAIVTSWYVVLTNSQLVAADRQRKAGIRPVVEFRNDYARTDWQSVQNPQASLVNTGQGVALNVRAWYEDSEGGKTYDEAASISVNGSHFTEGWYADLGDLRGKDGTVKKVWIRYEDAEGNLYYSHCEYADGPYGLHARWITRSGDGPEPPGPDPHLSAARPDS